MCAWLGTVAADTIAATQMLCDMADAGERTRAVLWQHHVLEFYLDLLGTPSYVRTLALQAIANWVVDELQHGSARAEGILLQPEHSAKIVQAFQSVKVRRGAGLEGTDLCIGGGLAYACLFGERRDLDAGSRGGECGPTMAQLQAGVAFGNPLDALDRLLRASARLAAALAASALPGALASRLAASDVLLRKALFRVRPPLAHRRRGCWTQNTHAWAAQSRGREGGGRGYRGRGGARRSSRRCLPHTPSPARLWPPMLRSFRQWSVRPSLTRPSWSRSWRGTSWMPSAPPSPPPGGDSLWSPTRTPVQTKHVQQQCTLRFSWSDDGTMPCSALGRPTRRGGSRPRVPGAPTHRGRRARCAVRHWRVETAAAPVRRPAGEQGAYRHPSDHGPSHMRA